MKAFQTTLMKLTKQKLSPNNNKNQMTITAKNKYKNITDSFLNTSIDEKHYKGIERINIPSKLRNDKYQSKSLVTRQNSTQLSFNQQINGHKYLLPFSEKEELQQKFSTMSEQKQREHSAAQKYYLKYDIPKIRTVTIEQSEQEQKEQESIDDIRGSAKAFDFDQSFMQLKARQIELEQSIQNQPRKPKGALPPREIPANQRASSLMHLSRELFQKQANLSSYYQTGMNIENSVLKDRNLTTIQNPYLITVTKDLFGSPQQFDFAQANNFNYDHKQFFPKTSLYSQKKEKLNDYKHNISTQVDENKDDLIINKFQMNHKYKHYERDSQLKVLNLDLNKSEMISGNQSLEMTNRDKISTSFVQQLDIDSGNNTKRDRIVLIQKNQLKVHTRIKKSGMISPMRKSKLDKQIKESQKFVVKIRADDFIKIASNQIHSYTTNNGDQSSQNANKQQLEHFDTYPLNTNMQSSGELVKNEESIGNHLEKKIDQPSNRNTQLEKQSKLLSSRKKEENSRAKSHISKDKAAAIMFFQTEIENINNNSSVNKTHSKSRNAYYDQNQKSKRNQSLESYRQQMQSPLRNSIVNEIMEKSSILDSGQSSGFPSLINLNNVNVSAYSKNITDLKNKTQPINNAINVTAVVINPSETQHVFGINKIQNTKDFLSTYFKSKDPKPFENFQKKYKMQKVRDAVAKLERSTLNHNANPNKTM
ncbi:UNKNOWN [Stylonychia lemnae]|uniref:Uncharacterized protein n=1 Tax=Stylonychia lemnae TaxID=5949 RepID=A0A078AUV3_STYLE|nr:UNKNOWN [Stylonychia lemnae]|eukprot:CDW85022.1 UNKNOWN [Stylonychia lemnae]